MSLSVSKFNTLSANTALVTGYPFTLAGWFRVPDVSIYLSLIQIVNTTSNAFFDIFYAGHVGRQAAARANVSTYATALSTTALAPNTWHHVVGVFPDENSRTVYLDGGNRSTNIATKTFVATDKFYLGDFSMGPAVDVAEAMILDVALTEQEIVVLARGFPVQGLSAADHLVAYYDCLREVNRPGIGPFLTISGSAVPQDHPPLFQQRSGKGCRMPDRVPGPYQHQTHPPLCRSSAAGQLRVGGSVWNGSSLAGEVVC